VLKVSNLAIGRFVDYLTPAAPNEDEGVWRSGEVSAIDGMWVQVRCAVTHMGEVWIDCRKHQDHIRPFATSNDLQEKNAHDIRMAQEQFKFTMTGSGFRFQETQPDGNCLFRAIAHQVYGDVEKHEDVRRECCDYMLRNVEAFSPAWESVDAFKAYVASRRISGEWGDDYEIRACEGANE
jgi:hypothetical protein